MRALSLTIHLYASTIMYKRSESLEREHKGAQKELSVPTSVDFVK